MIRSPEKRPTPSTMVLERKLDTMENMLRDALANVTKVNGSSNDVLFRCRRALSDIVD